MTLRLAHFSDLHLTLEYLPLRIRDWFGKRGAGWLNLYFRRKKHFGDADLIAQALFHELRSRKIDFCIFTGDATSLALPSEFDKVKNLLPNDLPPGIAIPGNHDHYTRQSVKLHLFEKTFAPWLPTTTSERSIYPFVKQIGPLNLIAANSSRPNLVAWDSRGQVGKKQMKRLNELISTIPSENRILVTHYPACLANGDREKPWRRLRDDRRLIKFATENRIQIWLHGHRHVNYIHRADSRYPFTSICAGSCTQTGRWTYNEYEISQSTFNVLHRCWSPADGKFVDRDATQIVLKN